MVGGDREKGRGIFFLSFMSLFFLSFFLFFLGVGEEEGGRGGEREEVKTVPYPLLFCVVPEPCVGDINQLASVCLCIGRIGWPGRIALSSIVFRPVAGDPRRSKDQSRGLCALDPVKHIAAKETSRSNRAWTTSSFIHFSITSQILLASWTRGVLLSSP